jgi:hypothetical protein
MPMSEVCALHWPRIAGNVPNELIIELFLGLLMLFLVPRIFLKGAPSSCPADLIADAGLRWCGATPS